MAVGGTIQAQRTHLGIPFYEIPAAVRQLLGDAKAWIQYKSYPPDEIASITGWCRSKPFRTALAVTPTLSRALLNGFGL